MFASRLSDEIAQLRDGLETNESGTELASILDSYRTGSLFGGSRLLIVPEVNAFVSVHCAAAARHPSKLLYFPG